MTTNEQAYRSAIIQGVAEGQSARLARQRDAVREELSQISDRAAKAAHASRRRARIWGRVYFMVGLPAAIFAAVEPRSDPRGLLALQAPALSPSAARALLPAWRPHR